MLRDYGRQGSLEHPAVCLVLPLHTPNRCLGRRLGCGGSHVKRVLWLHQGRDANERYGVCEWVIGVARAVLLGDVIAGQLAQPNGYPLRLEGSDLLRHDLPGGSHCLPCLQLPVLKVHLELVQRGQVKPPLEESDVGASLLGVPVFGALYRLPNALLVCQHLVHSGHTLVSGASHGAPLPLQPPALATALRRCLRIPAVASFIVAVGVHGRWSGRRQRCSIRARPLRRAPLGRLPPRRRARRIEGGRDRLYRDRRLASRPAAGRCGSRRALSAGLLQELSLSLLPSDRPVAARLADHGTWLLRSTPRICSQRQLFFILPVVIRHRGLPRQRLGGAHSCSTPRPLATASGSVGRQRRFRSLCSCWCVCSRTPTRLCCRRAL